MKIKLVPGTVGTGHHQDILVGERQPFIELGNRRIIPFFDPAQIDVGQDSAGQPELARLDAFQVDDRNHATDHHGPLHQVIAIQFLPGQRFVSRPKIHGFGLDLLDAPTRANGLVIEAVAGGSLVGFGPLGIDGVRKGGAGARDIQRMGLTQDGKRQDGSSQSTQNTW